MVQVFNSDTQLFWPTSTWYRNAWITDNKGKPLRHEGKQWLTATKVADLRLVMLENRAFQFQIPVNEQWTGHHKQRSSCE